MSSATGGDLSLAAAVVILTGSCGATIATPIINAVHVHDFSARGFVVGLVSHGIGTARAYTVDLVAGLSSGMAMGLNAIFTSLIVPASLQAVTVSPGNEQLMALGQQ